MPPCAETLFGRFYSQTNTSRLTPLGGGDARQPSQAHFLWRSLGCHPVRVPRLSRLSSSTCEDPMEIPLTGRYILHLAMLAPGSLTASQKRDTALRPSAAWALWRSAPRRNREETVHFLINGITLNNLFFNSSISSPRLALGLGVQDRQFGSKCGIKVVDRQLFGIGSSNRRRPPERTGLDLALSPCTGQSSQDYRANGRSSSQVRISGRIRGPRTCRLTPALIVRLSASLRPSARWVGCRRVTSMAAL